MLLSSERPLNIQHRRILQAGFTEAEHPEELGKEDLATLCKFIYQTPALPVMDPVSKLFLLPVSIAHQTGGRKLV